MLDFPEDPGSPLSSAAYHQGIGPGVVEHCSGFMRVSNIPIRDNRNGNTLLNCPNAVVFRVAVKQTGAGSAVNRQGLNTTVFGQLGNLYTVTMLWRPAGANLQRYRHIHRVNHRVEDPFNQIRVLQQGGPGKLPVHFFGRASHIDVDDLRAAGHVDTRGGGHIIRIASGNLHGADPWFIAMHHTQTRLIRPPHLRVGGEHLGYSHPSTHCMTEGSERAICNTGHRGRNQAISKLVVSNAHRQRVTILCPQGRVYYAFLRRDERPNFNQLARY